MMLIQKTRSQSKRNTASVVAALLLVAISLAIVALIIDTAMIFRVRRQLQQAADAAVRMSLQYRTRNGWGHFNPSRELGVSGSKDQEAADRARTAAEQKLNSFGYSEARTSIRTTFNSWSDTAAAAISYETPMFLWGALSGDTTCRRTFLGLRLCPVYAFAEAQLSRANVALVVDSPNATAGTDDQGTTGLRSAMSSLTGFLNPNRDRIGIYRLNADNDPSWFSIRGSGGITRAFGENAATFARFQDTLSTIRTTTASRPCDSLTAAYRDFERASFPAVLDNERTFFVLFTEGAEKGSAKSSDRRSQELCTDALSRLIRERRGSLITISLHPAAYSDTNHLDEQYLQTAGWSPFARYPVPLAVVTLAPGDDEIRTFDAVFRSPDTRPDRSPEKPLAPEALGTRAALSILERLKP